MGVLLICSIGCLETNVFLWNNYRFGFLLYDIRLGCFVVVSYWISNDFEHIRVCSEALVVERRSRNFQIIFAFGHVNLLIFKEIIIFAEIEIDIIDIN
jgi:hypothetical protein